jgi:hypothetical protein
VCSTFTADHPVTAEGEIRYLLAPPVGPDAPRLDVFREEMRRWPRAVGGLFPVLSADESLVDEYLADDWWRGLLLRPGPAGEGLGEPGLFDRLSRPRAVEMPLVIECGLDDFSRPEHLAAFLEACPPRPVVLTHGGQLNISGLHLAAAEELFKTYAHTFLETSGIYRQDFLERMVDELGYERILYGSGHPLMHEVLELERVRFLPVGEDVQAAIQGGNAARLFEVG